jgi:hypothetical protein
VARVFSRGEGGAEACGTGFWGMGGNLIGPLFIHSGMALNRPASLNLPAVWAGCILLTGIAYWSTPYNARELPFSFYVPGLLSVSLAALVFRAYRAASFWRIVLIFASTVPAVFFLRVVADTMKDPTTHNLWPFEIVVASGYGLAAAGAGALTGALAGRFMEARPARGGATR